MWARPISTVVAAGEMSQHAARFRIKHPHLLGTIGQVLLDFAVHMRAVFDSEMISMAISGAPS
jgi:hypothetical protein